MEDIKNTEIKLQEMKTTMYKMKNILNGNSGRLDRYKDDSRFPVKTM